MSTFPKSITYRKVYCYPTAILIKMPSIYLSHLCFVKWLSYLLSHCLPQHQNKPERWSKDFLVSWITKLRPREILFPKLQNFSEVKPGWVSWLLESKLDSVADSANYETEERHFKTASQAICNENVQLRERNLGLHSSLSQSQLYH